jgi:hypothetical protein
MMTLRRVFTQPTPSVQRKIMPMQSLYRRRVRLTFQHLRVLQAPALHQMEESRHG